MSRVQGKDSDLSSELPFSNLKDRCEACRNISACNVCGISISGFEHIGVRATSGQESGIWHYASPCRHRNQLRATSANVKYGGGPLWKSGYTWQSIYWGPYFTSSTAAAWVHIIYSCHLESLCLSRQLKHHAHSSVIITTPSTGPRVPSTRLNPIHVPTVATNAQKILWTHCPKGYRRRWWN